MELLLLKKKKINLVACRARLQGMISQKVTVVGGLYQRSSNEAEEGTRF